MNSISSTGVKRAVAGLLIAGVAGFSAFAIALAADPQDLQLKGQPVSKLVEALGEPKDKAPLPDGGQVYGYAYEHILKGGHIMRAQPRGKAMSQDMTHQCRADFKISKDGVVGESSVSGTGCPTK